MFREIEIKSYRGLRNIKLTDLERINVLIGENNSGKTSVLEAIQLFGNRNFPAKMLLKMQFPLHVKEKLR